MFFLLILFLSIETQAAVFPVSFLKSTSSLPIESLEASSFSNNCSPFDKQTEGIWLNRRTGRNGHCYLSLDPKNWNRGVNRSYVFGDDGFFMIFDSLDAKDHPTSTAARVIFFLSSNTIPTFEILDSQILRVQAGIANLRADFAADKGQLIALQGIEAIYSTKVTPAEKGGILIRRSPWLYLDVGYSIGADPTSLKEGLSEFVHPLGQRCRLKNQEIFSYQNPNDDYEFQWGGPKGTLTQFLQDHCPGFL